MKITDIKKKPDNPVTVLQFGEGKFLRAFMEDIIYESVKEGRYKGSVTVVKPRLGSVTAFTEQDCMYTLIVRGLVSGNIVDEKKIITSINEILKFYDVELSIFVQSLNPQNYAASVNGCSKRLL